MLRDGQGGSGPHQVVTGVVGEAAGFAQSAGGAHAAGGGAQLDSDRKHKANRCKPALRVQYTPALVAAASSLPPAGRAGRCGGGGRSGQGRGRHLGDLLGLARSARLPSTSGSAHRPGPSPQGLVDAALSRELSADLLHRLPHHLVLELHNEREVGQCVASSLDGPGQGLGGGPTFSM